MLLVFDLDFTLWDAGGTWCDGTKPPYQIVNGYIEDADQRIIYLYPDVQDILTRMHERGVKMCVASRTHSPEIAHTLMEMFGIRKFPELYNPTGT